MHRLWWHETRFSNEASSAAEARAFVSQHLLGHDMPGLVDDIELVVSELATNATLHARTPFMVSLCGSEETVRLEVSDGSRLEPSVVAALALDTDGRGVAIVQALSRDWGVVSRASGGKSVWAQFDKDVSAARALSGAPVAPAAKPGSGCPVWGRPLGADSSDTAAIARDPR